MTRAITEQPLAGSLPAVISEGQLASILWSSQGPDLVGAQIFTAS
jgi:hypothetical protein